MSFVNNYIYFFTFIDKNEQKCEQLCMYNDFFFLKWQINLGDFKVVFFEFIVLYSPICGIFEKFFCIFCFYFHHTILLQLILYTFIIFMILAFFFRGYCSKGTMVGLGNSCPKTTARNFTLLPAIFLKFRKISNLGKQSTVLCILETNSFRNLTKM